MGLVAFLGVGVALNELVTKVIPSVPQERVENYLLYLRRRLDNLSEEQLRQRFQHSPAVGLVEEGIFQAVRALSDERREQIANAVADGLSGSEIELIEARRVLSVFKELDEAHIIILCSLLSKNRSMEFRERHRSILESPQAHLNSGRDEIDRSVAYRAGTHKLLSLGLLERKFANPKPGSSPEFDAKTGMMKSYGNGISAYGLLFLRAVGSADSDDY